MRNWNVTAVLRTLLALGAIVLAAGAVAVTAQAVMQGVAPSPVAVTPNDAVSQAVLSSMSVPGDSSVVVQVSTMDRLTASMVAVPWATVSALVAAILALLSALLRDAEAGVPFTERNVDRLRWVARLTLLAAVVGWWLAPALQAWAQVRLDSAVISTSTSWAPVVVALGAYALVTIWQRGAELADFEANTV